MRIKSGKYQKTRRFFRRSKNSFFKFSAGGVS